MKPICSNCQYWEAARTGSLVTAPTEGSCSHPLFLDDDSKQEPAINGTRVASGYDCATATLFTGAEFGCIHFTAKA